MIIDLIDSVYDTEFKRFFKKGKCPICNCDSFDDPVVGFFCSVRCGSV